MRKSKFLLLITLFPSIAMAQNNSPIDTENWMTSPGIIGTFILISIVVLIAVFILSVRVSTYVESMKKKQFEKKNLEFSEELIRMEESEIDSILEKRKAAKAYKLSGDELGSGVHAQDHKGMVNRVTH